MLDMETVIAITQDALENLIRSAEATPEEHREWMPMDTGRTILDQLAECLQAAEWFARVAEERGASFFDKTFIVEQRMKREALGWNEVMKGLQPAYDNFYAKLRQLQPDDLTVKISLRPGWEPTLDQVAYFPLRNLYYHFGQVNYIQTLYGDKAMH